MALVSKVVGRESSQSCIVVPVAGGPWGISAWTATGRLRSAAILHAFAQSGGVGGGVFVETGVAHEGLESDGAGFGHGGEVREGVGDEASPESEVEMGLFERGCFFELEGVAVGDGWGGIERHVEEGTASSGGEGKGAGGEAFPLGAAGLVEVNVRVDPARDEDAVGGVDFLGGGAGDVFGEVGDGAVRDGERLDLTVGEGGVDEEVVVGHVVRLGKVFLPRRARRTRRIGLSNFVRESY